MSTSRQRIPQTVRKVSSITLKVIAGFFVYMVSLLAFVSEPPTGVKLGILIGFSAPAVVALCGGLALTRFRNWKRDTGIVLLSASGFAAFLIFTFVCLLMTEEFRRMMRPDTLTFFSDYLTGGAVIIGLAVLGWILMKANKEKAEQGAALDGESASLHPHH
jgi:cytosine/uracil/thiamine/allantoin permease